VALLPALVGRTKPAHSGKLGPVSCTDFREHSFLVLLLGELSLLACTFCYLWSSRSHGSYLYRDVISLGFQVKVAGHVVGGSEEL
jgi:hypothetical protein